MRRCGLYLESACGGVVLEVGGGTSTGGCRWMRTYEQVLARFLVGRGAGRRVES